MSTTIAAAAAAVLFAAALAGASGAWWLHRRTQLSARNLYLAWPVSVAALAGAVSSREIWLVVATGVLVLAATVAAVLARRWRLAALGAGGELRQHEQQRVMLWRARRGRDARQRVWIGTQGELIRQRAWPEQVPALPMTADGRARVPLAEGMHLYFVGATGAGKTTSARRWLLARGLVRDADGDPRARPEGRPGARARPARDRRHPRPAVRAV